MAGPRVVIIGAGVVGAALADEISARGWTEVTVVDQGPLPATGGSSSHAPGLVFQANPAKTMAELARFTVEKFRSLDVDGQPCFLQVGGLEIATTPERLTELHRRHGWVTSWGIEARLLGAQECLDQHPLLNPDRVLGGLFVPADGLARSVLAVEAQIRRATTRGVRFLARHEVLDVHQHQGRVTGVRTDRGEIPADVVVCCAGIWGPKIARMVGLNLPLTPLAHQLARTGPLPALAGQTEEAVRPILRHQDADLYYRDRYDCLTIGSYGHRPMPVSADDIRPTPVTDDIRPTGNAAMPSVLEFTEDDFAGAWRETRSLLPATRETKIEEGINGLFSFTTDGLPLLGESPDVKGFWVAEAVWVTHSAGVGRALAEWLVDGHCSTFDLHACDLNRFEPHQLAPDYVLARSSRNFVEVYDILHPLQPPGDPRPIRTSPFHPRQQELGAHFLEANGWERPQWYESNSGLLKGRSIPTPNDWAARHWSPIVGAEAQVTRERVALYDMTALKRLEVAGPGAATFLEYLCTGKVDKSVGSVTYTLLLGTDGGIRSDVTVARLAADRFQIGVNGNLDHHWLTRHLPADGTVQVRDLTPGTCCIGLWGPLARDVLQPLTRTDFSANGLKYFRAKQAYIGSVPVTAMRLSYVGELGWELYTTADLGLKLWDTLWQAAGPLGGIAAGRGAFNSLRLEKGYRAFGTDMTYEHDPYEAGLAFAVRPDKDFLGKPALLRRATDVRRRLTCLTMDDPRAVLMGQEPVYDREDRAVGYVTSAAYGYTVGRPIAYAWLPAELAVPRTPVHIGYFADRFEAVVTEEPLFDPSMSRLRG
ncbi:FAD-dependent oxidoreductase [Streptomyces sp. NPDC051561]|uniref:FAD-dependent oxidoreductase n=1 Tax=Streptomyces sp. NPDC051561 TaxID=3365658 RepID=UPI00379B6B8F